MKRYFKLGSERSAIRELFEYGKKLREEVGERMVFDFSLGNPSIDPPKNLSESIISLVNNEEPTILHAYQSAQGRLSLRKKIADSLFETYNYELDPNSLVITLGCAAALVGALCAVVERSQNSDAEVVVISPYFPEYSVFVKTAGSKLVEVKSNESFLIDFVRLEKAITKNTVALIINSPNNPTGVVYSEQEIKKLAKLLREKQLEFGSEIYLVSDEPYRELYFTEKEPTFVLNHYDNTIVCYSYSKTLSVPGERIGYALVGERADKQYLVPAILGAMRAFGYVSAPSLFQRALESVLNEKADVLAYKKNGELIYDMLIEMGYEAVKPQGAFYLFVKALEKDAVAFSERAKKQGLLIVPSDSFGVSGYVRIAFCVKKEVIEKSQEAFLRLYNSYKKS